LKVLLKVRNGALRYVLHLRGVFIGADDRHSKIGETGGKYSGEISRSIYSYVHKCYLKSGELRVEDVLRGFR